jgi:predicted MFS family arabinose efflux permease
VTQPGSSRRRRQSVVITDLGSSRTAEIRERERRYVIVMLFRAVCFIAATLLFHGAARWFAIGIAIMLPWLAVVLANAPNARAVRHAAFEPPAPRETPGLAAAREPRIIDPD